MAKRPKKPPLSPVELEIASRQKRIASTQAELVRVEKAYIEPLRVKLARDQAVLDALTKGR